MKEDFVEKLSKNAEIFENESEMQELEKTKVFKRSFSSRNFKSKAEVLKDSGIFKRGKFAFQSIRRPALEDLEKIKQHRKEEQFRLHTLKNQENYANSESTYLSLTESLTESPTDSETVSDSSQEIFHASQNLIDSKSPKISVKAEVHHSRSPKKKSPQKLLRENKFLRSFRKILKNDSAKEEIKLEKMRGKMAGAYQRGYFEAKDNEKVTNDSVEAAKTKSDARSQLPEDDLNEAKCNVEVSEASSSEKLSKNAEIFKTESEFQELEKTKAFKRSFSSRNFKSKAEVLKDSGIFKRGKFAFQSIRRPALEDLEKFRLKTLKNQEKNSESTYLSLAESFTSSESL